MKTKTEKKEGVSGIRKISDLVPGNEYWICYVPSDELARRCTLEAIVNDKFRNMHHTELYLKFPDGKELTACIMIGIGQTPEEAVKNYRKFRYQDHPSFLEKIPEECN